MPDNYGRMTSSEASQSLQDFCFPKEKKSERPADATQIDRKRELDAISCIERLGADTFIDVLRGMGYEIKGEGGR